MWSHLIEILDKILNISAQIIHIGIAIMGQLLAFHAGKERLRHGIVQRNARS